MKSIGSDTLNNLMALWAEGFRSAYPNVQIEIEGKGSGTAPPALIGGNAQFGPMSRPMKSAEIQEFEKRYGYAPTAIRGADRCTGRVRAQGQPDPVPVPAAGRRDLLQDPQRRLPAEHHDLGPGRPDGRVGQPADLDLRPQLRVRAPTVTSRKWRCSTATTRTR
jgi:hypothetical protein